jgi:hypothetical protein
MNLAEFVPAVGPGDSYVKTRGSVLSDERWRWLWRRHKARFVDAEAAILIGGQVHVHPERADAVICELGRAQLRDRASVDA